VIWLSVLCLDAPIVAVSWQWLFARTLRIAVPMAEREALFLTAWLIYLADRLADSIVSETPQSARQQFCSGHKYFWIGLIAVAGLLDIEIILCCVKHETIVRGLYLGGIALAYLAINHFLSKLWGAIPIKEVTVGFLFAAGTLLAVMPQLIAARSTIIVAAALFASLCVLNCISIAVWERDLDRARQKYSIATRWPGVKPWAQVLPLPLAAVCGALIVIDRAIWPLVACLGLSAVLLFALHFLSIRTDERTALGDLVLLTPLMFALIEKLL
jgi:hypothetical protein